MEKFCTQLTGPAFDGHFGLVVPYVFALGKKMNLCLCSLGLPAYFLQMFTIFIVLYYLLNL